MKRWWALRKKYTNAAEVGAMIAQTWDSPTPETRYGESMGDKAQATAAGDC